MSIISPSGNTRATLPALVTSYPSWVHPDVKYYEDDWRMIRDAYEGERAVKAGGVTYLPQMASMDTDQYNLFVANATFFNMTARTVGALTGTIFARSPVMEGVSVDLAKKLLTITKKAQSLRSFTQEVCREAIEMGRVGVLIDTVNGGDPYITMYVAESMLDWESESIDGREQLVKMVLMEMEEIESTESLSRKFQPVFRVLVLEGGVYKQKIFRNVAEGQTFPSIDGEPDEVIIPTKRGVTLKKIPFEVVGPTAGAWDMQRSPMLDIVAMNISHYRSYAQLEHGRYYTGFPIFWASKGAADQTSDYRIGPDSVWELPPGEKAGLMEFNGHGLSFLEKAITVKQGHIASLGGRMIGVEVQATAESDNQVAMKDRNEQSLLFEVTISLDESFTRILQAWAEWDGLTTNQARKIEIEFNKEFMLKDSGAREFRAIQSMWKDGLLPLEVVYDYLKKADVIPDWMELVEFKKLIQSDTTNNPDVAAKQEGYADAKAKQAEEQAALDREHESAEAKLEREAKEAEQEAARVAAEAAADKAAQIAKDVAKGKTTVDAAVNDPKPDAKKVDTQGRRVRDQQNKSR